MCKAFPIDHWFADLSRRDGQGRRGPKRGQSDYLNAARAFLASSFSGKLAGELTARSKAFLAPSTSPTFCEAMARWYWTVGFCGSLAALSLSRPTARW